MVNEKYLASLSETIKKRFTQKNVDTLGMEVLNPN